MHINKLAVGDKKLFNKFLRVKPHELSAYSFENIYIWRGLFEIFWAVIDDALCIFFKDKIGCFLYLPPLGKKVGRQGVEAALGIMDKFNRDNKDVSRIENTERKDLTLFRRFGYEISAKFGEYICLRQELAQLKGDKFRHKRACCNYFVKHYKFEYLPFSLRQHKEGCLKLYQRWARQRWAHNEDPLYRGMLKDNGICLKTLLAGYQKLKITGRVVRVDKKIKAFSFGFALNKDIFCILYEITDLSFRGAAQFIFRQFCRELKDYKYINIMDDSGLEGLKAVKLSYRPLRLIPSYIIKRKNEY